MLSKSIFRFKGVIKLASYRLRVLARKVLTRPKIVVFGLVMLLVGFELGVTFQTLRVDNDAPHSNSEGQRVERAVTRQKEGYESAKSRVQDGKASGELNQEQTDLLTAKIEEINAQQVKDPADRPSSEQRKSWRDWLGEHELPSKYLSPLY